MAITTYPLNNIMYNAEDAEIYNSTRTSGVFASDDFQAEVTGEDNNVTIREGLAWIHNSKFAGKAVALKTPEILNLSLPDNIYNRIDAIVLQYDSVKNGTSLIVKEGVAESNPKPPEVVQTSSVYELHLYHILRKAGASTITSNDITDLRDDAKYCGKMYDAVTPRDAVIPVRLGGTGATTPEQAKMNLGLGSYKVVDYQSITDEIGNIWQCWYYENGEFIAICRCTTPIIYTGQWAPWGSQFIHPIGKIKYPIPTWKVSRLYSVGLNARNYYCLASAYDDGIQPIIVANIDRSLMPQTFLSFAIGGRWK